MLTPTTIEALRVALSVEQAAKQQKFNESYTPFHNSVNVVTKQAQLTQKDTRIARSANGSRSSASPSQQRTRNLGRQDKPRAY